MTTAAGQDPGMRYVELGRHTDNDGDRLTAQVEILRHASGQDDMPITSALGLRSAVEDRWRQAAKAAGKGADLDAIRAGDPDLVERESFLLRPALRQVVGASRGRPGAGCRPQSHQ